MMLFFSLSGFLMGRLYMQEPPSPKSIVRYFRRRAARVMPLYLILVLLSFWWAAANGTSWPLYDVNASNLLNHLLFWRGVDVIGRSRWKSSFMCFFQSSGCLLSGANPRSFS